MSAEWRGVYNHFDSYPTELGRELYEHLIRQMTQGQQTLAEIGESILKFDDWRNYLKGGVCEYCGQVASQPHDIALGLMSKAKPGKVPDPHCKHHQHTPLDETYYFTQADLADTDLEWVYILNPAANAVHVLDLRRGPHPTRHIGDMTFDSAPDFPALECGPNLERCGHMAWKHFPEIEKDPRQNRLNTQEYLGLAPLEDRHSVCAYLIGGKRYTPAGSGVNGAYVYSMRSLRAEIRKPDPRAWYELLHCGKIKAYFPVARFTGNGQEEPYPGVTWVFPPTRINPNETLKSLESAAA